MKEKTRDLLTYFIVIVVVILCIYLIWFTKTESYECINNPLPYGVSKLSTRGDENITCSCTAMTSDRKVIFNSSDIFFNIATIPE